MDHRTQYLCDLLLKQHRHWGLTPNSAVIEQSQTNGVAERVTRTLKEQVIHGRILITVDELRLAAAAFVDRYNARWRVETLCSLTPAEARLQQVLATAA